MELELLDNILPTLRQNDSVITGPGDDCAVVEFGKKKLLLAVDQVTEKVHFTSDTAPERAGAKLVKRNLSDIAAMGGTPLWMLLAVSNGSRDIEWVRRFVAGAEKIAEEYNVPIVGGDTSSLPAEGFSASLTIAGSAETPVLRSGAKPQELLYVTGLIGNSFASEHHLDFIPHLEQGRLLNSCASAMMDVSDGLLLDAKRMAKASNVDFYFELSKIPLRKGAALSQALGDGEDYCLLFTCDSKIDVKKLFSDHKIKFLPVCIGRVEAGNGTLYDAETGKPITLEHSGYEH